MADSTPKTDASKASSKSGDDPIVTANQNKAASAQSVGADISAPVSPDEDELLARAQRKAPSLTAEFAAHHELTDEYLEGIANGTIPPPPSHGPDTDVYLTPGGWQAVPAGVKLEDVGKGQVGRS